MRAGVVDDAATASAASRLTSVPAVVRRVQPWVQSASGSMSDPVARRTSVIGGMVADDVDHRHVSPPSVVQVRQAVTQAGTQMQQSGGRLSGDPA